MTPDQLAMLERMFTNQIADLKEDHRAAREESREDHKQVKDSIQGVDEKLDDVRERVARLEWAVALVVTTTLGVAAAVFHDAIMRVF